MFFIKKYSKYILILLLIFFSIYIYKNLDKFLLVLKNIDIFYFSISLFCMFLFISLKILRLFYILKQNSIKVKFEYFLKIYSSTAVLSFVSNYFLTEAASAGIMMSDQKNKLRVANIYILCNFIDLINVLLLLSCSFLLNFNFLYNKITIDFLNINKYICIFILLVLLLFLKFYKKIIYYVKKVYIDYLSIFKNSSNFLVFCSIILNILYVLYCFFVSKAFNLNVELSYLILTFTLGGLISILPISISGLGTREAILLLLLKLKSIASIKIVMLSLSAFWIIPFFIVLLIYLYTILNAIYNRD